MYRVINASVDHSIHMDRQYLCRIDYYGSFDNGHVLHNDWKEMYPNEASELAKQASIDNPDRVYYVKFDDIMNDRLNEVWYNGRSYPPNKVSYHDGKAGVYSTTFTKKFKVEAARSTGTVYTFYIANNEGAASRGTEEDSFEVKRIRFATSRDALVHAMEIMYGPGYIEEDEIAEMSDDDLIGALDDQDLGAGWRIVYGIQTPKGWLFKHDYFDEIEAEKNSGGSDDEDW